MRLMVKTVKEEKLWNMQPWFSWDTNVHTISICGSYATTSYKKPSNYPLFSKFLCLCIILSFESIPYTSIFFVIYLTANNAYNESFSGYSVTLLVITIFKSGAMRTKFNQLSSFFCRRKVTTILLISNMCHLKRYTILYVSRVHIMKPKM